MNNKVFKQQSEDSFLWIAPQRIVPLPRDELIKVRKHFGARAPTVKTIIQPYIKVQIKDIDTRDKLAWVLHRHLGYGVFNVRFWLAHQKNNRYNPQYICPKCYREEKGLPHCNIKRSPEGGIICARNRQYVNVFKTRACIKITEANDGYEYKYEWLTYLGGQRKDKMSRFWWWRGEGGKKERLAQLREHFGDNLSDYTQYKDNLE